MRNNVCRWRSNTTGRGHHQKYDTIRYDQKQAKLKNSLATKDFSVFSDAFSLECESNRFRVESADHHYTAALFILAPPPLPPLHLLHHHPLLLFFFFVFRPVDYFIQRRRPLCSLRAEQSTKLRSANSRSTSTENTRRRRQSTTTVSFGSDRQSHYVHRHHQQHLSSTSSSP